MRRFGVFVTLVVLMLMATTASAQQVPVKDVRSVLEASMKAMGGTNLKTIQYFGRGWNSRVGQTYTLNFHVKKCGVAYHDSALECDVSNVIEAKSNRQSSVEFFGKRKLPPTK